MRARLRPSPEGQRRRCPGAPILCERIAGMARLLRGYTVARAGEPALLARAATISPFKFCGACAAFRATILLDYMLVKIAA